MQSSPPPADNSIAKLSASLQLLSAKSEAAAKALGTFELVEMIVTYLPPKGVVAVQRVGHIWNNVSKDIIKRSPYLTETLSTIPVSSVSRLEKSKSRPDTQVCLPNSSFRYTSSTRSRQNRKTPTWWIV